MTFLIGGMFIYEGCSEDLCIFSFLSLLETLSLVHWSCDHLVIANIVLIFDIYIHIYDVVTIFKYLSMCYFFSLFIHIFLIYVCNLYFCFTLRYLDEFCLKCFRNTGFQSLSFHDLSSYKVFQEFVLGLDFIVFNKCI